MIYHILGLTGSLGFASLFAWFIATAKKGDDAIPIYIATALVAAFACACFAVMLWEGMQ